MRVREAKLENAVELKSKNKKQKEKRKSKGKGRAGNKKRNKE